ncbi:uncharacterized protein LOC117319875 [Pecten maximus]|uniref:uncharacterized protein LOC117319875 n=1 Tax=Pecten maximus TaxID=6579 RepID=UPI001458A157|nr:uncharacterized protein LOC117319875 [Pecten maximus]
MQGLLLDECDLHVYDHQSNTFTPELVECAMNLTNLKVATHNVGPVIREVSSLCGKIPNRLPSRTTVDNMVDRKVSLSQKQLGTVLSAKEETTLYTDETRKHGHTYQSYLITDKDKNSYLLGLREMENKSGQCTLDTMKEILKDISDYCSHSEDKEADCEPGQTVGYHILKNVCNTMSDRASTEKHFNVLLQEYRNKILPDVVYNYTNLTTQEKELCGQMNNFFCGLHLLVGIADVSEASLKKFETAYLDGKLIGSAQKPELQRYHKSESGTLRLLRTCSKAFAMGEDEKNGVFLPWKTYLGSKGEKKNHILRFKHNRFNMVFLIGQAVYYHSQDIQEFLGNVHGTSNDLLKAVLLDAKETLFLAGAKVLGLVSKFITAPLWRLIEAPGHILDMNMHFETLVDFLEKTSTDTVLAQEFLKGQSTPFNSEVDSSDAVLAKLLAPDELETIALPLVQSMCVAMKELLKRMVSEHLPGGKFWNVSSATRSAAESALKHNKSPEFIFGQLDHLISYRPNASVLANEAYLLYSYNKTSDWLHNLPDDEKKRVIESSRKEGRELRQKFKERLKEIEQKRLDAQKRKQLELKRLEQQRILKAENLTNDVCFYGLWQSVSQIEEGLSRLKGDKGEMLKALYSQLKFRRYVLKQRHSDSKVFNMSRKKADGKYEKLSVAELKANVTELIKSAATVTTDERQTSDIPLLVGKTIDHVFVDNTYRGVVVSVVPGFPMWYNVKYTNDEAIYAYNLIEDYRNGDVRIVVSSHSK